MLLKYLEDMAKKRHLRKLEIALGELKDFNIIHDTFIWDVLCAFRKFGRYVVRSFQWIPVLWRDEDWDYCYLLYIMRFKLQKIEKCLSEDDMHVDSDKRARQVKVVLAHLDRYFDIGKYTIDVDVDEYLGNSEFFSNLDEDGHSTTRSMRDKDPVLAKKHNRIHEHQRILSNFHYKEFWRKLSRNLEGWWI